MQGAVSRAGLSLYTARGDSLIDCAIQLASGPAAHLQSVPDLSLAGVRMLRQEPDQPVVRLDVRHGRAAVHALHLAASLIGRGRRRGYTLAAYVDGYGGLDCDTPSHLRAAADRGYAVGRAYPQQIVCRCDLRAAMPGALLRPGFAVSTSAG